MPYANEELQAMIVGILSADYSQKSERSSAILKVLGNIEDEQQKIWALTYALKNFGAIDNSGEVAKDERMSDEKFSEIQERIGLDLRRAFHSWIRKNPPEDELAGRILRYFQTELKDGEEKSVALAIILMDRHIPYVQIPDVLLNIGASPAEIREAMEGEKFDVTAKEDAILIQNIVRRKHLTLPVFIMLWNIIRRHESEAEQVIIFGQVVSMIEKEAKKDALNNIGGLGGLILGGLFR